MHTTLFWFLHVKTKLKIKFFLCVHNFAKHCVILSKKKVLVKNINGTWRWVLCIFQAHFIAQSIVNFNCYKKKKYLKKNLTSQFDAYKPFLGSLDWEVVVVVLLLVFTVKPINKNYAMSNFWLFNL